MALRRDWTVELDIADVRKAAEQQLAFAEQKVRDWTAEQDSKEQELRERGLTFAAPSAASNTSYNQQQIVADPLLMKGYQNALYKVTEWSEKAQEFREWCRLLTLWKRATIDLDRDDISFFRL